jgi:hypothetical protein
VSDIGTDILKLQHVQTEVRAKERRIFHPFPENTEHIIDEVLPRLSGAQFHKRSPSGVMKRKSGATKEMACGELGVTERTFSGRFFQRGPAQGVSKKQK